MAKFMDKQNLAQYKYFNNLVRCRAEEIVRIEMIYMINGRLAMFVKTINRNFF